MADIIKVTFPDGTEFCYKSPVNTVISVLKRIGKERFPEINFMQGENRVVSRDYNPKLKNYLKEITDGWYYFNQNDTRGKTNQLINLNNQFNLGMKIEVGAFKGTTDPSIPGTTRSKNRIVVTMPDGKVINHESYRQVLADCIYRLGPRRVSAKANIQLSKKQDLFSATNLAGNRFQLDETLYMLMPHTAKDAMKVLKIIASRLNERISVEYLPMSNQ